MSAAELIRAAILRRWPCQAVPHGTQVALATEFGVTREFVRQQLNRLGYAATSPKPREITVCGGCGKEMNPGVKTLCYDCRLVELPCEECGKPKKVSAAALATKIAYAPRRAEQGWHQATGRVFCDRVCFGRWVGKNRGFGAHPENIKPGGRKKKVVS